MAGLGRPLNRPRTGLPPRSMAGRRPSRGKRESLIQVSNKQWRRSVGLDAGVFDHFAPFFDFAALELREFGGAAAVRRDAQRQRSEEHTSELQSRENLVCR